LTVVVSDDLSTVDAAQLERWAFGRATTPDDQARATAAIAELQRRAAAELERAHREAAERAAAEAHAREHGDAETGAAPAAEPLTDSERRHRRRMLITGIAGLTAAALSLGAGVYVLNQPDPDSDPLAIFEREETQLDRDWATRLESWGYGPVTAGPRAIEVDDEVVVVAARISTVPDRRSTEWDAYCLFLAKPGVDGSWEFSGTCTYPEKFERDGLTLLDRPSATGEGFDTASWGPTGGPQFQTNVPLNRDTGLITSVLDVLAFPRFVFEESASERLIDDESRLLMGPEFVTLFVEGPDIAAFRDSGIETQVLLISGERPSDSPLLCVHVDAGDGTTHMPCMALDTARREGMEVSFTAQGRNWLVSIGADGRERSDTVRLLD